MLVLFLKRYTKCAVMDFLDVIEVAICSYGYHKTCTLVAAIKFDAQL